MFCTYCQKTFKNLKLHQKRDIKCSEKIQISHKKTLEALKYFNEIPKNLQIEILKYLPQNAIENIYFIYPEYFEDEVYNNLWQRIFNHKFKLNRTFSADNWGKTYVNYMSKRCFVCSQKTSTINHFIRIPICFSCAMKNDQFKSISKTLAKKEYFLTDNDFINLEYIENKNRYGTISRYYLLQDIENLSNLKFGEKLLEDKKRKRESRRQKIKNNKIQKQLNRKKDLEDAMKKQGLLIRSDSQLCQNFILGTLDKMWTLNDVVDMCGEMKWLFEYTPYKKILDETVKQDAKGFRKFKGYSWSICYQIAFEECEPIIREEILKKYPKPTKWPWLKQKKQLVLFKR